MGELDGRVALITGASSGLGAHFAELFVEAGARVVLGARRLDRVEALAARLGGERALAVRMNVADEASTIAAFDAAEDRFGLVDTVIANAGQSNAGRVTHLPSFALRATIDTNLTGVLLTAREGARRLIAGGSATKTNGRIVLIGSITAHMTGQGDAAYAATKAAVAHLGRNLAREWVRAGVNVNVVQPGYIRTAIGGEWWETEGGRAQIASWHRRRMMPVEALDAIMLHLASDASLHMTGSVVDIDDGQSL